MKRFFLILICALLLSATGVAQPESIGAGLSFATKKRFNGGDTGNPGLNLKTWIPLDKKKTFHIVPSATVYNPLKTRPDPLYVVTTVMFHADLDAQYLFLRDKNLKLGATVGGNYTYISTKNKLESTIPASLMPVDSTLSGFGPTAGAVLEMRINAKWDFILSAKYNFTGLRAGDKMRGEGLLAAPLGAPVIQVHGAYYFSRGGSGYYRR